MTPDFLAEFEFFAGVPDSQLKALCSWLYDRYGISDRHVIAANEGNAAALAAGLALAAVWGNVTLLLAGLWMLAVLLWDKFGRHRGKFRIFWK